MEGSRAAVTHARWCAVLLLMIGGLPGLRAESRTLVSALQRPKLEISALRARKTRIEGGDWDDKTEWVSLTIRIRNLELNKDLTGLTAHYWIFGKSVIDRKVYKVIQVGEFSFSLSSARDGREITHESEEVILRWDNTDARFGERYDGWLIVVENAEREVVAVKSTNPAWERDFDSAFSLQKNGHVDSRFRSAPEPTR